MMKKRRANESDTDSDRTVYSDELIEFISLKEKHSQNVENSTNCRKRKITARKREHEISDDSEDEVVPEVSSATRGTDFIERLPNDKDKRPLCKFGSSCYRKNPLHLKQFRHDEEIKINKNESTKDSVSESSYSKQEQCTSVVRAPGFYVTKVHGIPQKFNESMAVGIKDLLSPVFGKLKQSAQFNYMIDVPWLMEQYPEEFQSCPLLLVHGEQRESKRALQQSALLFKNITFAQASLPIMYGTHHTKMMLLLYETGLRIVIHTCNLISQDWYQKTQGVWLSPIFPSLRETSAQEGDSPTYFKTDLLDYLNAYNSPELKEWCNIIKSHDLSTANVFLIGSVPGRHLGTRKTMFGHLKLRKVLTNHGPEREKPDSQLIGQFSSIGSLGATAASWLLGEWFTSLATTKCRSTMQTVQKIPLHLVFPSVENVRRSLEGYPAGASLPYSKNTAVRQPYLKSYFHHWKAEVTGRSAASPHIKTYLRVFENKKISWFLVTSANLSKAAWGMLEKQNSQLMIRSYELGVLFLPQFFGSVDAFTLSTTKKSEQSLLVPYDIPLTKYTQNDEPWTWDSPHTYAPDRHGNMWEPS